MVYSLAITILATVAILFVISFVALTVRRIAKGESAISLRGWRWYPSPLGLLVLAPIVALLAWRMLPALILLPIVLPFFRRGRGGNNGRGGDWRDGPPPPAPPRPSGKPIEAQYRPRDKR